MAKKAVTPTDEIEIDETTPDPIEVVATVPINLIEPKEKHADPPKPKKVETEKEFDFSPVIDHINNKFEKFEKDMKAKPSEAPIKSESKKELELGGPLTEDYINDSWVV